jgi:hypothetical protein
VAVCAAELAPKQINAQTEVGFTSKKD